MDEVLKLLSECDTGDEVHYTEHNDGLFSLSRKHEEVLVQGREPFIIWNFHRPLCRYAETTPKAAVGRILMELVSMEEWVEIAQSLWTYKHYE